MNNFSIDEDAAWVLLLGLKRLARKALSKVAEVGVALDERGTPVWVEANADAWVVVDRAGGWRANRAVAKEAKQLFDLYANLCVRQPLTVGHLGQSIDGRIATEKGASCYVTGPENLTHLHRMRALCDAVLVGASTVSNDNPQLTTRRTPGPNPVRVILDPRLRLHKDFTVFQDGVAPTLVVYGKGLADKPVKRLGQAELMDVPVQGDQLCLKTLLDQLHERGLYKVFVEGGGITVSRFLQAGLLNRLQIAIAPLIIGSGRPGIALPVIHDLSDGLRPRYQRYAMGEDVFFDLDLSF